MRATDALAAMRAAKSRADARADFERYIERKLEFGWTKEDAREYMALVKVLMGNDDAATLALYPEGLFKTAEECREAACQFWKDGLELMA